VWQIDDQLGIKLQSCVASKALYSPPASFAARNRFRAAHKRDFAMSESVQVRNRGIAAAFVIDGHRAGGVGFELAADDDRRNTWPFQVGEQIDIQIEPVGHDDEGLHTAL